MANILDYLVWRGDLPFAVSGLNEVDGYLLSKIGCPDYTGIVPENGTIPLKEAVRLYGEKYPEKGDDLGVLASDEILPAIRAASNTKRFENVLLSGFVKKESEHATEQFSALILTLDNGARVVTFRGTDDTLVGWKENFQMGLDREVPAQIDAVAYLEKCLGPTMHPVYVIGHSKGGNLAVWASSRLPKEKQEYITAVYNYDGPGFYQGFLNEPGYKTIQSKIHTILPQYSLIGTLLFQEENRVIVHSRKKGAGAHDGFQWSVYGTSFVHEKGLTRSSVLFEEAVHGVLKKVDVDERKAFIDGFFDTLGATGAKTITDLSRLKKTELLELGKNLRKNPAVADFFGEFLTCFGKDLLHTPNVTIGKELHDAYLRRIRNR